MFWNKKEDKIDKENEFKKSLEVDLNKIEKELKSMRYYTDNELKSIKYYLKYKLSVVISSHLHFSEVSHFSSRINGLIEIIDEKLKSEEDIESEKRKLINTTDILIDKLEDIKLKNRDELSQDLLDLNLLKQEINVELGPDLLLRHNIERVTQIIKDELELREKNKNDWKIKLRNAIQLDDVDYEIKGNPEVGVRVLIELETCEKKGVIILPEIYDKINVIYGKLDLFVKDEVIKEL